MPSDSAPKSAYELAMERLRRQDEAAGVQAPSLSDEQREAIAEARRVADAKVAEARIMHRSKLASVRDPVELAAAEEALRRDVQRIREDCERRIEQIRGGP